MDVIKKAVFPVAGLGARFLPITKASPKEMLPIVDKPLIQYAVEEAIRAGITHMIFVTNSRKRVIEDHFDSNFELEYHLEKQGKEALLDVIKNIAPPHIQFTYIRQNEPLGLGHAILCAERIIGKESFAVLLADDLIDDTKHPCLSTMLEMHLAQPHALIAIQPISWDHVSRYGAVDLIHSSASCSQIRFMVEKPSRKTAPSNDVAIGRYVFNSQIFSALKQVTPDKQGEIQLTCGINQLLKQEPAYAWRFQGKRFDCGDKLDYFKAIVKMTLQHTEMGEAADDYLRELHLTQNALVDKRKR